MRERGLELLVVSRTLVERRSAALEKYVLSPLVDAYRVLSLSNPGTGEPSRD